MKNIIVLYTTFLLLSLFSACTTKDKPVIYPNTGGPVTGIVDGSLTVGTDSKNISDLNLGTIVTFKTSTHSVKITFNNSNLSTQVYKTKSTVTADNETKIEIRDTSSGEVYLVEDDSMLALTNTPSDNLTITSIVLVGAGATPTLNTAGDPIDVSFSISIKK